MSKGILYIIFSLGAGGTQRNLVNIINSSEGKRKILFLYNDTKKSALRNQLNDDVIVYSVKSTSKFKNYARLFRLIYILKKENIDSIISFAVNGTYLALVSRLLFPLKKINIYYRMVSVVNQLLKSDKIFVQKINKFFYEKFLCRGVDLIICQSVFMQSSLLEMFPKINPNRTVVVNNVLNTNLIDRLSDEIIKIKENYFIYVGRLSPEKNIIQIIEAFTLIKNTNNIKLLIIGEGIESKRIKDYVNSKNIKESVIMLGFQENPYKYIKNAICLVLFSKYEGLPNVVLESMYCRTPVIISDFEGSEEVVKNDNTGYIVPVNDIKTLSSRMNQIINSKQKRNIFSTNAFNFVKNRNNISLKFYKDIVER